MRGIAAIALLFLVPACGNDAAAPEPPRTGEGTPATPRTADATPVSGQTPLPTGPGSRLSGQTSSLAGQVSDFAVERTAFGTRVQIAADTLFEFDKAALTPAAQTNLLRMAELVRQGRQGAVTVTGHSDAKGEDAYNLDLSRRRAEAVVAWLRTQPGMDTRMFAIEGRGETEPVAPNNRPDGSDDPDGRARNRRVTIDIPR